MAIYFIDLRDPSGVITDEEGHEFSTLEDALEEAKANAHDLVRQYIDRQIPLGATCVEVRDAQHRTVVSLTVAEVLEHPQHPYFKNACTDSPRPGHH